MEMDCQKVTCWRIRQGLILTNNTEQNGPHGDHDRPRQTSSLSVSSLSSRSSDYHELSSFTAPSFFDLAIVGSSPSSSTSSRHKEERQHLSLMILQTIDSALALTSTNDDNDDDGDDNHKDTTERMMMDDFLEEGEADHSGPPHCPAAPGTTTIIVPVVNADPLPLPRVNDNRTPSSNQKDSGYDALLGGITSTSTMEVSTTATSGCRNNNHDDGGI